MRMLSMPDMVNRTATILVRLSLSMGVEGKIADKIRVNKQELAETTLTTAASVSASAAWYE